MYHTYREVVEVRFNSSSGPLEQHLSFIAYVLSAEKLCLRVGNL